MFVPNLYLSLMSIGCNTFNIVVNDCYFTLDFLKNDTLNDKIFFQFYIFNFVCKIISRCQSRSSREIRIIEIYYEIGTYYFLI